MTLSADLHRKSGKVARVLCFEHSGRQPPTGFGLGFSVRTEITTWDPSGHVGEYGWGGAASTHYWVSPADKLIVITLEQIMPYQ